MMPCGSSPVFVTWHQRAFRAWCLHLRTHLVEPLVFLLVRLLTLPVPPIRSLEHSLIMYSCSISHSICHGVLCTLPHCKLIWSLPCFVLLSYLKMLKRRQSGEKGIRVRSVKQTKRQKEAATNQSQPTEPFVCCLFT